MKIRKAFVMSVNAGAEQEYEKRHSPIWPELEKVLKDHGVSNYSIFLHPDTHQLFGYAEIESEEQWASIASTEICQKWWKHMSDVMPSNVDHCPVSVGLREVFHLDRASRRGAPARTMLFALSVKPVNRRGFVALP